MAQSPVKDQKTEGVVATKSPKRQTYRIAASEWFYTGVNGAALIGLITSCKCDIATLREFHDWFTDGGKPVTPQSVIEKMVLLVENAEDMTARSPFKFNLGIVSIICNTVLFRGDAERMAANQKYFVQAVEETMSHL